MKIGYVYELRHESSKDLLPYVGKTLDFDVRKRNHKSRCNNPKDPGYNFDVYKYIRANGGWSAWYMIEIYYGPDFEQKEKDLLKENFDKYINSEQTGRTIAEYQAEYREQNKEVFNQKAAEYRDKNRAKINQKIPCKKCGKMISRSNIICHMRTKKCMNYSSASSSESSASEVG